MIRLHSRSDVETKAIAAAFATTVSDHDLVLLSGDLGAGKTTFTQGFAAGFGIDEQVTSPTFVLVRTYQGRLALHHADVYRVEKLDEVLDLGLLEMLDEGGVAFIEWGEVAAPVMPRDYLQLRLEVDSADDSARDITFSGVGQRWTAREQTLRQVLTDWMVEDTR